MKKTELRGTITYIILIFIAAVAFALAVFSAKAMIRAVASFALSALFIAMLVIYARSQKRNDILYERSVSALASVSDRAFFEWDYALGALTLAANFEKVFSDEKVNVCSPEEALVKGYIFKEDIKAFNDTISLMMRGETSETLRVRIKNKNGDYLWYALSYRVIYSSSGKPERAAGFVENINKAVCAEMAASLSAETDELTGLPNRTATENKIKSALLQGMNHNEKHALFIVRIDNLNDILSEVKGEKPMIAITEFADGLKRLFRTSDIVGRISENEFAVLMKYYAVDTILESKAAAITELMGETSFVGKKKYLFSGRVGVAVYPVCAHDASELFSQADKARRKAEADSYCIICE